LHGRVGVGGEVLDRGLPLNIFRPAEFPERAPVPSAGWRQRTFLYRPQTD